MKHYTLILATLLSLLLPVQSRGANFQKDEKSYMRGDYSTALKEFEPLAKLGDFEAQVYLGYMYHDGQGVL